MISVEWFDRHAPGYAHLTNAEREAIGDFSQVWPLFEGKVLGMAASSNAILEVVQEWEDQGKLANDPFAYAVAYFQDRYVENGQLTYRYQHLNFRANDPEGLVRKVVKGEQATVAERTAAAFVIVYRYRNNLFHGGKLAYVLQEQQTNFETSTRMLRNALDLHAGFPIAP